MSRGGVHSAFERGDLTFVDEGALAEWIARQRWYATKGRGIGQASIVQSTPLDGDPQLILALVQLRFHPGTTDLYNMLIGIRPSGPEPDEASIFEIDGWVVYGALENPEHCRTLGRLLSESAVIESANSRVVFNGTAGAGSLASASSIRALTGEQSNTSLVYDEQVVVKVFRRLAAGINPELEMLRFLSERDYESIPELLGWFEHDGEPLDATLGIAVRHVDGARDGWRLVLDSFQAGEAQELMGPLAELGAVTGRMHTLLASDASNADFAPEEPTFETTALLAATIDEQLERTLDERHDDPALEPLARRSEELREYVRKTAQGAAHGRLIRHHGDFHLGQTMATPSGWVIIDFEGEPDRPLLERRRKRSALRDVACMLRSFAYAAAVAELQLGVRPGENWVADARTSFVDGYLGAVDASLLPPDRTAIEHTLTLLELEKAVYELRYEVDHRPDWVPIAVAALLRLLEARQA